MSLPLIGFLRIHRRIALALLSVVVSSAIILPACGDGGIGTVTPPGSADFSITKTGVVTGQTITYTISVTNNASSAATVTVTDVVNPAPAGSQFTSFSGATCTVAGALSYTCELGPIQAASTRQLLLVLTVPPGVGGGVVNCASIPADASNSNNRSCAENSVVALTTGTITIQKDAEPNDAQDFRFTSGSASIPAFDLDDDSDPALSNQKVFTNLPAGTYTFTETQTAGWDLAAITCTPSTGTTTSVPTATATIVLTAGASIVCVFNNRVRPPTTGTITIIKDAVPNSPQDFGFTSNKAAIPAFVLDDDADPVNPNQRAFANVAADTYVITETPTPGWSLANIACTPAASVVTNIGAATATITLAGGASVSCTYTNVPVAPTIDAVSSTTSSSTSTTVTVAGTGFVSGSTLTLRNTTTGVTSAPTITTLTESQFQFAHGFGITTVDQNYTLEITGPNGVKSAAKAFTVLRSVPVITALNITPTPPTMSGASVTFTVTVTGTDFSSPDARLVINVTPVNDPPSVITIENSALTLKTSTQAGGAFVATTAGRYDVRLQNGLTGTVSNSMSFNVAASATPATITSISPASPTGSASAQPITINGTGFPTSAGITVRVRNVDSGAQIDCPSTACTLTSNSPTQLVVNPTFGVASSAQVWTIQVLGISGGPPSNAFTFTVNPPPNPAAFIVLTPTVLTVGVNGTADFTASFLDASRQPTTSSCPITFSTVDASGIVTVVAVGAGVSVTGRTAGTTGVRAACTSGATTPAAFTGTVRVTQAPLNIASMAITPRNVYFPESATSSTFRYTGTAKDGNGNTVAGATVTYSVTSTGSAIVSIDDTGLLTIGATASGAGGPAKRGGGVVTARSGGQSTFASFTYGDAGAIKGQLRSTGGQYLIGYTASTSLGTAGIAVGDVDSDGVFFITGLPPGDYVVTVKNGAGTVILTSGTLVVTARTTTVLPDVQIALRTSNSPPSLDQRSARPSVRGSAASQQK